MTRHRLILKNDDGWPSIRSKALSSDTAPKRCVSTANSTASLRTKVTGVSLVSSSGETHLVSPTIDSAPRGSHDFPLRTSRLPREARAPNQFLGLIGRSRSIPGHPRATLDMNDLWICLLGAHHPVESYRQAARGCYFSHALGLAMTTMQIRPPQTAIAT